MKKYGKTFGCFDGLQPVLWTTDTELIRSVFVKDFDHFVNRRVSDINFDPHSLVSFNCYGFSALLDRILL